MIIQEKDDNSYHFVYAAYQTDKGRIYLVIPYHSFGGLSAVSEKECTLIDNNINGYKLMVSGSGRDIIIHWSVAQDALIDKLVDHERGSVDELLRRLREDSPPEDMPFPEWAQR